MSRVAPLRTLVLGLGLVATGCNKDAPPATAAAAAPAAATLTPTLTPPTGVLGTVGGSPVDPAQAQAKGLVASAGNLGLGKLAVAR